MSVDPKLIRNVRRHLEAECSLYERYIALLKEQRKFITQFNAAKIEKITQERDSLTRQIQAAHAERLVLMQQFPGGSHKRLSQLMEEHCPPMAKKHLLSLVERLRELVTQSRRLGVESNKVIHFAMNFVNGSISLLWQATQNVNKSYSRKGASEESFNPRRSREETLLRQA